MMNTSDGSSFFVQRIVSSASLIPLKYVAATFVRCATLVE